MNFDSAFAVVSRLEGHGKVTNNPKDPGGLTKWGISLRSHPVLGRKGILALDEQKARAIYKEEYWDGVRADELSDPFQLIAFDGAVNLGIPPTIKHLQRALCDVGYPVDVDGVIGPQTLRALQRVDVFETAVQMLWRRLNFYRSLSSYDEFGKGWERRVLRIAIES